MNRFRCVSIDPTPVGGAVIGFASGRGNNHAATLVIPPDPTNHLHKTCYKIGESYVIDVQPAPPRRYDVQHDEDGWHVTERTAGIVSPVATILSPYHGANWARSIAEALNDRDEAEQSGP